MAPRSDATVTFRATLLLAGRTATGIEVPDDVVQALGAGRQPLVHVALGGYRYRSRLGVRGGRAMLPVSAAHREQAGVAAGDEVEVTLQADTEPREVTVPPDLATALDVEPATRARFEALSPSRKGAIVVDLESARTTETRQRRLARALAVLRGDDTTGAAGQAAGSDS